MMVQLQFAIRYDGMHAVREQAVTGDHKVYTNDYRLHADCNSLTQLVFKSQSVLKYGRLNQSKGEYIIYGRRFTPSLPDARTPG